MAKTSYKIPASLSRSYLDHEIPLGGKSFQMKPLPLKVILFWVASIVAMFTVLSSTLIKDADWWLLMLVVVWWLLATSFFGRYSKTKELKLSSVPALLNYVPASARKVTTRKGSDPSAFYSIAGLDSVAGSGLISWADGTVGRVYLVVGSASILVFEQDKIAILNRVDAFYRKLETDVELIWLTTKQPQRVYRQLANLDARNLNLQARDPELVELMEEQYSILKDHVGGSFNSIHQYLVVKADNLEALTRAHVLIRSEVEGSSLMMKQLTVLDGADALEMLSTVYAVPR